MSQGVGHSTHKLGRDTYAVRIENIAACVGRHEIIELFSNLIGALAHPFPIATSSSHPNFSLHRTCTQVR
jgi:hypothetical protein